MAPPTPSSVRFFQGDHPAVTANAGKRIEQYKKEILDQIAMPPGATDFAAYKYRVGIIEGLNQAITLIEQTEEEFSKANR